MHSWRSCPPIAPGIRTALGSTSRSLIVLLMRSIVFWSVGGILAGVALALLTLGLLERFLFEVAILDGRAWSVALVVSLFTAVTAAWVPARRAATADPLLLLRTD
jgi:ABC-type antimicrobial peptide transport system permease subunit